MIRTLTQEELAERWSEIKPWIERAVSHGIQEMTAHDMFVAAMNGEMECLEAILDGKTRCFSMCRINYFPQHKQLQIVTAAGEGFDEYAAEGLAWVEGAAKELGCKYVCNWGRPGFVKKYRHLGYKHTYTVLTKEVL